MEGSKTSFSLQNPHWHEKDFFSEFIDNLGTRPQTGSPALLQTDRLDTSKVERNKILLYTGAVHVVIFRYESNFRLSCFAIIFQTLFGFCVLQTKKCSVAKQVRKTANFTALKSKIRLCAPCITVTASQIS